MTASETPATTLGSGAESGLEAPVGTTTIRLAILEADTPQPRVRERLGTYGNVFAALFGAATRSMDPPREIAEVLSITKHDVVNDLLSYPALEDVDAVLITGSKHTAFENDEWIVKLVDFTRRAVDSGRVRVLGVCFGHQIVGRAMGAEVGKSDKGWEVAVTEVGLTDKGKEIFQLDTMHIHQMHRDVVFNFPSDAVSLAYNTICPVQSMYSPRKYMTVQGHPEFTEEIVSEILTNRRQAGVFDDDFYADGMRRVVKPHDGVAIARAFIRFMREG